MSEGIFPFTLFSFDHGHFVERPREFEKYVREEVTRRGETYYAFNVTILSPSKAEFAVYGMRDKFRGSIGRKQFEFAADMFPSDTRNAIVRRAAEVADRELRDAARIRRDHRIAIRANELLAKATQQ